MPHRDNLFFLLYLNLQSYLEDTLLNVTLAEHRGVTILREENRELTLGNRVEALRNVGEELNILSLVELGFGGKAILLLAPAKYLGRASEQKLNIDILTMQLQTSLRYLTQIQLLNAYEDVVAIDIVTATGQRCYVVIVDKIKYLLKAGMKRRILRLVFQ